MTRSKKQEEDVGKNLAGYSHNILLLLLAVVSLGYDFEEIRTNFNCLVLIAFLQLSLFWQSLLAIFHPHLFRKMRKMQYLTKALESNWL